MQYLDAPKQDILDPRKKSNTEDWYPNTSLSSRPVPTGYAIISKGTLCSQNGSLIMQQRTLEGAIEVLYTCLV